MPTYQKKPVRVQAFQLGQKGQPTFAPEWFLPRYDHITDEGILIETLEGTMLAGWGDYVIQGIKGEIYPCKPDIFEASYDLVNQPTSSDPFGEGHVDQNAYILEGINNLRFRVNAMTNGREKSVMLTKLDELRHWNEDERLRKHYEGGGM